MDFIETLPALLKLFWFIAIPTSVIFIIQTIMTFTGSDASDGVNADFTGDLTGVEAPFQLFSLRNLINFLLGFSWSGISFYGSIVNSAILIIASLGVGLLFVFMFFLIIQQIQKLAEDNTFQISMTLHKTADVYLPIPESKRGKGKILISVNGSVHELEAITEHSRIEAGMVVKVVKIESENVLVVEKI